MDCQLQMLECCLRVLTHGFAVLLAFRFRLQLLFSRWLTIASRNDP